MGLQSQLFRNDPSLEAAAADDAAHIVPGARGSHVAKIQLALVELDGARLTSDGSYGAVTAAAVLAFKQKRQIINRSYQTQADNIVGKMTMAALDKEMFAKENQPDEPGRIHCQRFPFGPSPGIATRSSFAVAAAATPLTPRGEALRRVMGASIWVASARNFIRLRSAQLLSGLPAAQFQDSEPRKALDTHFKLDRHPRPLDHLALLDKVYGRIQQTLAIADSVFVDDPRTGDFANAFLGGFHEPNHPTHGKIRFGPAYAGKGELFQTSVLVHEGAHFVDHLIGHFASELPAPNGSPVDSSKNYVQLTPIEASHNAYSYAQFALHAFKGTDKRIVPFNE